MRFICLILMIIFLNGCSTILGSTSETVIIEAQETDTLVEIRNSSNILIDKGMAPIAVNLKKSNGYFKREHYKILAYDKYENKKIIEFVPGISPIYFLNLLIPGGQIAMLTLDPYNGSMWTFYKDSINIGNIY